jgi:AcrR family transcriptional regulator
MPTQDQRSQATRDALIDAGLELFARRGYADVAVGDIAKAAGVTTGALYHQFASKQGLFKAVYDHLVATTGTRIATAREHSDAPSIITDCEAYLDACADPAFHRIAADGPAVISWDLLVDDMQAFIKASLIAAQAAGEIAELPVAPVARMLAAALKEAGLMIATADDPIVARAEASAAARHLLAGLRKPGQPRGL